MPTFKFLKSYGCIERLECSAFNNIKDTIKDVSNYKEAAVIGDASWIHIFSKTRPSLSLVTWPLIEENKIMQDKYKAMFEKMQQESRRKQIIIEELKNRVSFNLICPCQEYPREMQTWHIRPFHGVKSLSRPYFIF